ncbi:hypothetical protein GCE9029_00365 [Grimontia celer]|uniref:Uncharacterized protein n=1 Tax=Grimontia celer TaxID=1796497 RepID=A0A128EU42_9GAMM|nr:hypothetical protein [Grimontia celer]CZF77700.1 hypothetical protein GCE9029_00365 [Grimontia celer]
MLRSRFFFLLLATLLVGCITPHQPSLFSQNEAVCESRLSAYYKKVEHERDFKLPYHQDGRFPHLAFNRFSTSFVNELSDAPAKGQWLAYVAQKGKVQLETALTLVPTSAAENNLMMQCQKQLVEESIENPKFWSELEKNPPAVPTAYEHWKRILGVYPVASLVAEGQIEEEQERIKTDFGRTLTQPFRYGEAPSPMAQREVAKLLSEASKYSSLNWPLLTDSESAALLDRFSPFFLVETLSVDDIPGTLAFESRVFIDTQKPVLYRAVTYTRFHGKVLPQLNYALWFPARTAKSALDPYAGEFDAVNIRITLGEDGKPLILDSIHQCGCYHMVYALSPTLRFLERNDEKPIQNYLFPNTDEGRFEISLTAEEHMINAVHVIDNIAPDIELQAAALGETLVLSDSQGNNHTPFDEYGILNESLRGERWFLWPFGVRSPGAMRQYGQHAIAFIGERHFDDAFLLQTLLEQ